MRDRRRRPRARRHGRLLPLTDGGEGFCSILTSAAGGTLVEQMVTGPRGAPTPAALGLVRADRIPAAARQRLKLSASGEHIAIIEMALASGLALLPPAAARSVADDVRWAPASSSARPRRPGPDTVLLGVGGSATNDLGVGALDALGLQFHYRRRSFAPRSRPRRLGEDHTCARHRQPPAYPACTSRAMSPIPCSGRRAAPRSTGPQKGLREEDWAQARGRMRPPVRAPLCASWPAAHIARYARRRRRRRHLVRPAMRGRRTNCFRDLISLSAWFDLEARIAAADVVVTGEGRFDDSSLSGKGPGALVRRALELGKEVHVFAGQIGVTAPPAGLHLHAISEPGSDLAADIAATSHNLATSIQRPFSSP